MTNTRIDKHTSREKLTSLYNQWPGRGESYNMDLDTRKPIFGGLRTTRCSLSDFIWDFGKLPFSTPLGKYFIKIGKIRAKIHEIGKIKAIFGLGMTPIYGLKNGQIKSLSLISLFVIPFLKSIICKLATGEISIF